MSSTNLHKFRSKRERLHQQATAALLAPHATLTSSSATQDGRLVPHRTRGTTAQTSPWVLAQAASPSSVPTAPPSGDDRRDPRLRHGVVVRVASPYRDASFAHDKAGSPKHTAATHDRSVSPDATVATTPPRQQGLQGSRKDPGGGSPSLDVDAQNKPLPRRGTATPREPQQSVQQERHQNSEENKGEENKGEENETNTKKNNKDKDKNVEGLEGVAKKKLGLDNTHGDGSSGSQRARRGRRAWFTRTLTAAKALLMTRSQRRRRQQVQPSLMEAGTQGPGNAPGSDQQAQRHGSATPRQQRGTTAVAQQEQGKEQEQQKQKQKQKQEQQQQQQRTPLRGGLSFLSATPRVVAKKGPPAKSTPRSRRFRGVALKMTPQPRQRSRVATESPETTARTPRQQATVTPSRAKARAKRNRSRAASSRAETLQETRKRLAKTRASAGARLAEIRLKKARHLDKFRQLPPAEAARRRVLRRDKKQRQRRQQQRGKITPLADVFPCVEAELLVQLGLLYDHQARRASIDSLATDILTMELGEKRDGRARVAVLLREARDSATHAATLVTARRAEYQRRAAACFSLAYELQACVESQFAVPVVPHQQQPGQLANPERAPAVRGMAHHPPHSDARDMQARAPLKRGRGGAARGQRSRDGTGGASRGSSRGAGGASGGRGGGGIGGVAPPSQPRQDTARTAPTTAVEGLTESSCSTSVVRGHRRGVSGVTEASCTEEGELNSGLVAGTPPLDAEEGEGLSEMPRSALSRSPSHGMAEAVGVQGQHAATDGVTEPERSEVDATSGVGESDGTTCSVVDRAESGPRRDSSGVSEPSTSTRSASPPGQPRQLQQQGWRQRQQLQVPDRQQRFGEDAEGVTEGGHVVDGEGWSEAGASSRADTLAQSAAPSVNTGANMNGTHSTEDDEGQSEPSASSSSGDEEEGAAWATRRFGNTTKSDSATGNLGEDGLSELTSGGGGGGGGVGGSSGGGDSSDDGMTEDSNTVTSHTRRPPAPATATSTPLKQARFSATSAWTKLRMRAKTLRTWAAVSRVRPAYQRPSQSSRSAVLLGDAMSSRVAARHAAAVFRAPTLSSTSPADTTALATREGAQQGRSDRTRTGARGERHHLEQQPSHKEQRPRMRVHRQRGQAPTAGRLTNQFRQHAGVLAALYAQPATQLASVAPRRVAGVDGGGAGGGGTGTGTGGGVGGGSTGGGVGGGARAPGQALAASSAPSTGATAASIHALLALRQQAGAVPGRGTTITEELRERAQMATPGGALFWAWTAWRASVAVWLQRAYRFAQAGLDIVAVRCVFWLGVAWVQVWVRVWECVWVCVCVGVWVCVCVGCVDGWMDGWMDGWRRGARFADDDCPFLETCRRKRLKKRCGSGLNREAFWCRACRYTTQCRRWYSAPSISFCAIATPVAWLG